MQFLTNPKFDFMKYRRAWAVVSAPNLVVRPIA